MRARVDPFGPTCDPRLYVPRRGTEAALRALRDAFATGRGVSVLSGPPGLGKTMLLQVLAAQLSPARCVYLPYVALGIEELALVALDRLGAGTLVHEIPRTPGTLPDESRPHVPAADAPQALAAAARRDLTVPLVLLLDDASALPLPTARALRGLVEAQPGALRVVAAVVDDARASRVIAALGDVAHVRLRQPLTPPEARDYVRGRLARAGHELPAWALEDDPIDALHREAGGVPREVNTQATLRQRAEAAARERAASAIATGSSGGAGPLAAEEGGAPGGLAVEEGGEASARATAEADAASECDAQRARDLPLGAASKTETRAAVGLDPASPQAESTAHRESPLDPTSATDPSHRAPPPDAPPPTALDPDAPAEAPRPPRRRRRLRRTRGWY